VEFQGHTSGSSVIFSKLKEFWEQKVKGFYCMRREHIDLCAFVETQRIPDSWLSVAVPWTLFPKGKRTGVQKE
jgi:hypothetical protein